VVGLLLNWLTSSEVAELPWVELKMRMGRKMGYTCLEVGQSSEMIAK
jgi:hypothetical protein